MSNG
jgi:hypothetical protein